MASIAPLPTPLTAPRPKRIAPSATENDASDALTSGGSTAIPRERASVMYLTTLSVDDASFVINDA